MHKIDFIAESTKQKAKQRTGSVPKTFLMGLFRNVQFYRPIHICLVSLYQCTTVVFFVWLVGYSNDTPSQQFLFAKYHPPFVIHAYIQ